MRIGKLRNQIEVQRPTATLDTFGQKNAWETFATVWANVRSIGGAERLRANVTESRINVTIHVRYSATLMPPMTADAWRILHDGRVFNIIAARPDYKNTEIIFDCSEGSIDGK